ncbi:MAG: ABC transporter substrate-binding protein [candidate division WOR-3 bacterium]
MIIKGRIWVIAVFGLISLFLLAAPEVVLGQSPKEPIRIGLIAEKTGALAAYGYSHEKVMRAAVEKVNKEGGIGGRRIELFVEDTETKPATGALKFRKLVETNKVDFVFNSNSSGIAVACAPIARELKVPYFPCASAAELAGEKGNRYVFQVATNVAQECKGAAAFAVKNIARNWVTVVVDYAWGWSNETEFSKYVQEHGGRVLKSVRVPLGTGDWLPYLKGNIPKEAEAVFFANFGTDFLSFIRDLYVVRPDIKKLGAVYALSAQDPKKLGREAEGLFCLTSYPTRLEGLDTSFNRAFRAAVGMDPDGKEVGTGKYLVPAYNWAVWESLFMVKAAIEKSGWKHKGDTPKLIETLETMTFKESIEHPQGDKYIRAEDHITVSRLFVEKVEGGEIKVVAVIPGKDTLYSPVVDRRKEPF